MTISVTKHRNGSENINESESNESEAAYIAGGISNGVAAASKAASWRAASRKWRMAWQLNKHRKA